MRISLVTATLNGADTLRYTLQSVLGQEYEDYELIVVDGGSTDGTLDIIREFEPLFDGRLRWVSEPDRGLYDAMNKGIRMAAGDIVGIINSDDFYHRKDILGVIDAAFSGRGDIQAIYSDVRYVNPGDLGRTVRYKDGGRFRLWKMRWGWFPAHPTFFTYRANFDRFGFYREDFEIAADIELMVRFLYTHRLPAMYVPVDFVTMRTGGIIYRGGVGTMRRINREIVRACKENGIYTNVPMVATRYVGKVWEMVCPSLRGRR